MAFSQSARISVPISQTAYPNGDIRYSVPIRVGDSPPIEALLDTGSTGLRVMRGALQSGDYVDTGFFSQYAFSSGDELGGTIATANVAIGAAATDQEVPVQVINSVSCMNFRPNCGAATLSPSDYGIGGDGIAGAGFQAILGVSLQPASGAGYTENPLMHIGARRWIIELPEPGGGAGALVINPDAEELQNGQMFPLKILHTSGFGQDAGFDDSLPGCLDNTTSRQNICGPTILDSGSPGIIAYLPNVAEGPLWSANDSAALSFAGGGSSLTIPFTVDRTPGTGLLQQPAPGASSAILGGFLPFFYYDVLYDASAGAIGLLPRADAPAQASTLPRQDATTSIEVIQLNAPEAGAPALPVVITPGP